MYSKPHSFPASLPAPLFRHRLLRLFWVAAALCCGGNLAIAQGLKVTTSGGQPIPENNDGSTWEKAFSSAQLQERLTATSLEHTPPGNGEFWLKSGVYPVLWLHAGTKIYGGFDGTESQLSSRDPVKNRTSVAGIVINRYEVFGTGPDGQPAELPEWPDGTTLIDGCDIANSGLTAPVLLGGSSGFPTDAGTPVISNCRISRDGGSLAAVEVGAGLFQIVDCEIQDSGDAGVYINSSEAVLELLRCNIHDNQGAGVFAGGGGSLTMTDCNVTHNCSDPAGPRQHTWGGVELDDPSIGPPFNNVEAKIRHCDISHNFGVGMQIIRDGGDSGQASDRKVLVEDCTITDNVEQNITQGGGVRCVVDSRLAPDDVTFTRCQILNNSVLSQGPPVATGGEMYAIDGEGASEVNGGGFYIIGTSIRVEACVISGNSASNHGGGIYLTTSGGDTSTVIPQFRDCLIVNNNAGGTGGGINLNQTQARLVNCTIADNHATAEGGAIYSYMNRDVVKVIPAASQRVSVIANCAFSGNTASTGNAMYHSYGQYSLIDESNAPQPPTFINCSYRIGDAWLRFWHVFGADNIAPLALAPSNFAVADAGFTDVANGDYHLTAASLLRDKGDNTQVETGEVDLDGQPRIAGTLVDVGAYEFATTVAQVPPLFTMQPANASITPGGNVTFAAAATGTPAPALHWQRETSGAATWNDLVDGGTYAGTATGTLQVNAVTLVMNGDQFRAVADNGVGPPVISNAASLSVANAPAIVTITNTAQTYSGAPEPVTVATSPAGLSTSVTYNGSSTVPTNAGTYAVAVTVTTPGYAGSATATLTIAKQLAAITMIDLLQVYDGTPKPVTIGNVPPGVSVIVTYDGSALPPTAAGKYTVVATVNDPNYFGITTNSLTIDQLPAGIFLTNLHQVYDGSPKSVTASTLPTGLPVSVTYNGSPTAPIAAGTYIVEGRMTDPNYFAGPALEELTIAKQTAFIHLSDLNQTYDGTPKAVTVTTDPAGLRVIVLYEGIPVPPSAAGPYSIVAQVVEPNFEGTSVGVLFIGQGQNTLSGANQTVTPAIVDSNGNPVPNAPIVVLNFEQVTAAGNTTITMTDSGPPPPTGFRLAEPPRYLDIKTTATFTGKVKIAVDYSSWTLATAPADLRLSHFVGGAWMDITTSNDTADEVIYGETTSFSPFAVLRPATPLEQLGDLDQAVAALHANQSTIRTLHALLLPVRALLKNRLHQDDLIAVLPLDLFVRVVQAARGRQITTAEANELIARGQVLIAALRKEASSR